MSKKAASRAKSSISGAKSMHGFERYKHALGEQLGDDFELENGTGPWAATTGALDWLTPKRKAGQ
jgi:hypothetical protein